MNNIDVTVLLITYNSQIEKINITLDSIMMQENINLSIVVADDGSKYNNEKEIINYFENHSFSNYQLVMNKENHGTVLNILTGLNAVKTEYVKAIGPGDLLYDKNTLFYLVSVAMRENADIVYGNAVYFINENGIAKIIRSDAMPYYKEKYLEHSNLMDICVIDNDKPHGAAELVKTESYMNVLHEMQHRVIYAEDLSIKLMVAEENNVVYVDKNVILYEFGNGISTSNSNVFSKKLDNDVIKLKDILCEHINDKKTRKRVVISTKILIEKNKFKKMLLYLAAPKVLKYRLDKKFNKHDGSTESPSISENEVFYKMEKGDS